MGGQGKKWTEEEDNYIRERYPLGSIERIAAKLGRTYFSVASRARTLGIQKKLKQKRSPIKNPKLRISYREETECLADIICFFHRRGLDIKEISLQVRCPEMQAEEILERCQRDGSYERYIKQENAHITGIINMAFDFSKQKAQGHLI